MMSRLNAKMHTLSICISLALSIAVVTGAKSQTPAPVVTMDAASLFDYDKGLALSPEEGSSTASGNMVTINVKYQSINNQKVPAVLVLPKDRGDNKIPCVVLMHGLGMNKMGLMLFWGQFIKSGFAVISIDAQYHGDRAQKPAPELFGSSVYATRELLIQTVVDLRRTVDYLETRPEIDSKRIGYVGFSMGGILGSIACSVDKRFVAPVLALAGGDWKLMSAKSKLPAADAVRKAGLASSQMASVLEPVDPVKWVAGIAPRPVLFINGDADDVVPVECGRALHAAAGPISEVMIYKGGHVPAGAEMLKVITKIGSWCDAHLKAPK
ncbi:MAG: alpha/beta fold hydrolase [Chthonomonadales bacterium]